MQMTVAQAVHTKLAIYDRIQMLRPHMRRLQNKGERVMASHYAEDIAHLEAAYELFDALLDGSGTNLSVEHVAEKEA